MKANPVKCNAILSSNIKGKFALTRLSEKLLGITLDSNLN